MVLLLSECYITNFIPQMLKYPLDNSILCFDIHGKKYTWTFFFIRGDSTSYLKDMFFCLNQVTHISNKLYENCRQFQTGAYFRNNCQEAQLYFGPYENCFDQRSCLSNIRLCNIVCLQQPSLLFDINAILRCHLKLSYQVQVPYSLRIERFP